MTPDDLVQIEAIRQLKARYFRLMDQKRWDDWLDVFTDDVHIDTSQDSPDGVVDGRERFVSWLSPQLRNVITCHHGHMSEIEITGPDTASATWAMEDHLEWPPDAGMGRMWGTGWYEEEYRRGSDGRWRIASLKLRRIKVELEGRRIFPPGD